MGTVPEWLVAEIDWDRVPGIFQSNAIEDFRAGDISGALAMMDNMVCPFFVRDNLQPLRAAGMLEAAVLESWINVRVNAHHTGALFDFLFSLCDQKKLRTRGDPIPGSGPYTLYRGCSGRGRSRHVRGFSWTASFDRAKWFAERFRNLPDPAVYRIEAPKRWVLAYTNERQEQEFILRIPREVDIVRIWRGSRES
jgi:hypothetical protein